MKLFIALALKSLACMRSLARPPTATNRPPLNGARCCDSYPNMLLAYVLQLNGG